MAEKRSVGAGGIMIIAVMVVVVAAFFLMRRDTGIDTDTLERIRSGGVVRIGYANEAPYGYLDSATGEVTGEAPEIAKVILNRIGAEHIEAVVTEFGSLIPGLQAGRFDIIAAGMYITPPRAKEIAFSNPTYVIGEGFIVRSGNPLDLHGYDDIAGNPDARLGIVGGTVEHGYARDTGIPDDQIVVFPDNASAVAGVVSGRVDAFAGTDLTVRDLIEKSDNENLEQARPFHNPMIDGKTVLGYGAFGFRKTDTALRDAFNRQLDAFIGSPEHLELVRPFGFTRENIPDVTTEQILRE